jgi:ankyrin repeat protein
VLQAACLGANDIVQLLLDAGADIGAVDAQGFTGEPSSGHEEVKRRVEKEG